MKLFFVLTWLSTLWRVVMGVSCEEDQQLTACTSLFWHNWIHTHTHATTRARTPCAPPPSKHTATHTHMQSFTHVHAHMHGRTLMHTHTFKHTHTHICAIPHHIYTHTNARACLCVSTGLLVSHYIKNDREAELFLESWYADIDILKQTQTQT